MFGYGFVVLQCNFKEEIRLFSGFTLFTCLQVCLLSVLSVSSSQYHSAICDGGISWSYNTLQCDPIITYKGSCMSAHVLLNS